MTFILTLLFWLFLSFKAWPWLIATFMDYGWVTFALILTWPFIIISLPSALAMSAAGSIFKNYTK